MSAFRASLIFAALLVLCAAMGCGGGHGPGVLGVGPGAGGGASGGAGPWGAGNVTYGAADGIREAPVVGISTDESQNLWVATHEALYLLKPGEKQFRRFDAPDGLHLAGNPVSYCDSAFAGGDRACPIGGAATEAGITEITGGGPDEVFVGYAGDDEGNGDWSDPGRHSGKLDRVRLGGAGLAVDRFDLVSSTTAQFWHDRTVHRLLYDHFQHPHELYVGTNHGIDRLLPDRYRAPRAGEWFLTAAQEWMSDHLHPQVCYHRACDASESGLMLGDWKGLALGHDGNLWVGGRWTGGEIRWTPGLHDWLSRPGDQIYAIAFGDGYVQGRCNAEGFCNQPVFPVAQEGDVVSVQAVAVAPDGRVWFASGRTNSGDQPRGLAVWDGKNFRYYDPQRDLGMPESDLRELVALPDGRLAIAGASSGVTLWDPKSGAHVALTGLPDPHVLRMELDTMVSPPALHVATYGGAASLRSWP